MRDQTQLRLAFTLVELVVVVMILGILAAIAVPRVLGMSGRATDNGVRHSLSVVRPAIERFAAEHDGELPGADGMAATFLSDLSGYLGGGELPMCPVDGSRENEVHILGDGESPGSNPNVGTHAWAYNHKTGEFHVNCPDLSSDQLTTYDQF
jgi:prepilin-type N-terminal cleavage/methylation domain-containing protein